MYWAWCAKFLRHAARFHGEWRHPTQLGREDVERWLSELANQDDVSAGTQNLAFSSVCYLYREVLGTPLENVSALRAKRPHRIRDVVDQDELVLLFAELQGPAKLAALMMYASSFRIGEIGRIRVKDISFERCQIVVRSGKGAKDRVVGFPANLHAAVHRQIESMRVLWRSDVEAGLNGVSLPKAWGRKSPSSHLEFAWWYLFASDHYSRCPKSGRLLRHHRDMGHIARQIKKAARDAGLTKRITSHCLRHSFATHSLENGVPIHFVQKLMGHGDIRTTEGYLHVMKNGVTSAESPLTRLETDTQPLINSGSSVDLPSAQTRDARPKLRLFAG